MGLINNNFLIADKGDANIITVATVVKTITVALIYVVIFFSLTIKMTGYSIKLCEVAPTISLNHGSIEELMDLKLTSHQSNIIIQNRPYKRSEELYWNQIIDKETFNNIKWRISCD